MKYEKMFLISITVYAFLITVLCMALCIDQSMQIWPYLTPLLKLKSKEIAS